MTIWRYRNIFWNYIKLFFRERNDGSLKCISRIKHPHFDKKGDKTLSKSTMTHPRMHLRGVGPRRVNLIHLLQPGNICDIIFLNTILTIFCLMAITCKFSNIFTGVYVIKLKT